MLAKNIGAWDNSGFRRDAPELVREYIDGRERAGRKFTVHLLGGFPKQYGYETAIAALEMSVRNGSVNKSDAAILAARISGYGIDTPPEPDLPLSVYDKAFLPAGNRDKAVGKIRTIGSKYP